MKRIVLRISIAVIAFVFSLIELWIFDVGCEVVRTLKKSNYSKKIKSINDPLYDLENTVRVDDEIVLLSGCGINGHSETYKRKNGELILSAGYWEISRQEFYDLFRDKEIIEGLNNANNRSGEKGVKIFAKSTKNGEMFHIYWYGKGSMYSISAPTMEIALDFEKRGASAIF